MGQSKNPVSRKPFVALHRRPSAPDNAGARQSRLVALGYPRIIRRHGGKAQSRRETVRRGINRAREVGFLREVKLVLNPNLVGCESTGIQVEVDDPERRSSVINQVGRVEGVVNILNLIGRSLRASFYYKDEQGHAKTVQRISDICNSKDVRLWRGEFPPNNLRLHTTDWANHQGPAQRPPTSGVRHRQRGWGLNKNRQETTDNHDPGKSLLPHSGTQLRQIPGVASYIIVTVPDQTRKALIDKQILAKLDRGLVFSRTDTKTFSMFTAVCLKMSEADDIHRWIRGLDGVEDVRMDFIKEIILPKEWLDREIDRHLLQGPEPLQSPVQG